MTEVDPLETTGKSFHPNGIPGSEAHAYRARAKGADRPALPIFCPAYCNQAAYVMRIGMESYCQGAGGLALSPVHLEYDPSAECQATPPGAEGSNLKRKEVIEMR